MEEGYIKFDADWLESVLPENSAMHEINQYRQLLLKKNLIGVYPDGIGFGNISVRINSKEFMITGSSTGHLPILSAQHFAMVHAWNFSTNRLRCTGGTVASSESLTHAAVYESAMDVKAVIHVHHLGLWSRLKGVVPTTSEAIPYGTPGMAAEVGRLFLDSNLSADRMIVMGGHKEGILCFGSNLSDATAVLLAHRIE